MTPTDLVVVLPGMLGSTLRKDGELVWAPSAGSALRAIATFGRSITGLRLPPGIGDNHPGDGVEPVSLMPDLHVLPGIWTPVKGYDKLLAKLESLGYRQAETGHDAPPGNLLPFAYDWRLSCRYNGERLGRIVEPALERWRARGGPYADARVVFVCHSMGGLVARWYIEMCGGAQVTRKLITLGTPYRGAAHTLGQLVNGAHPGVGPFRLGLADFARSLPSLHQLLPEYTCIEQGSDLIRTTDADLPALDAAMVRDAMAFHTALWDAEWRRPTSLDTTHAIVGIGQTTATTARLTGGRVELVGTYQGMDLAGDATVPIVGACRVDELMTSNRLRRVPDKHGNLHRNPVALNEIEGILTARHIVVKAVPLSRLRVDAPDFALAGEDIVVTVTPAMSARRVIRLAVSREDGKLVEARTLRQRWITPASASAGASDGTITATIAGLRPGAYTIDLRGEAGAAPFAPVSSDILVWPARFAQ